MSNKMSNSFIALCTMAISFIYGTSLFVTEPQSEKIDNNKNTLSMDENSQQLPQQTNPNFTITPPSSSKNNSEATTKTSEQTNTTSLYKDGTFTGSGTNRIGTIKLAVTIKQGIITSVEITSCTTHYSQRRIDPELPNQVLSIQSGNVDAVSGATRSSEDFQDAINVALEKATI